MEEAIWTLVSFIAGCLVGVIAYQTIRHFSKRKTNRNPSKDTITITGINPGQSIVDVIHERTVKEYKTKEEKERQKVYNARYNAKKRKQKKAREYYQEHRQELLEKMRARRLAKKPDATATIENQKLEQTELPIISSLNPNN